ncbi:MAG: tRNA lysidine(34) synthetase TilS [Prevotella sp.]|nr:tRNA lysidine(34) synthetase TilS [Prevotella sp.]
MVNKVQEFIRKNNLLQADGHYLVALSGGADSVCLLLVMKQLGYFVEAIHCNFHLRGEESDRDENFCKQLCADHQVKLHLVHFDTAEYASLHKMSIEMAARHLRYHHFAQLCHDLQFDGVCVAHHQDDVAETVLMNLIRGTGIKGLTGIKAIHQHLTPNTHHPLTVIRPFLCISRHEIEDFLGTMGQGYVTDSTNLVADVVRNKIRLQVLPLLSEINPSASKNIVETAENLSFADEFLDQAIAELTEGMNVGTDELSIPLEKISNEYVLFRLLSGYGFSSVQIKQVYAHLDSPTGTQFLSPTHILVFDRSRLLISKQEEKPFVEMRLTEEGVYCIGEGTKLKIERFDREKLTEISRSNNIVMLDADKLSMPLTIRRFKEGDRFHPFGLNSTKLVSDFLTDQKLSLIEKHRQLIIHDSTGKIIWVVARRLDNRFKITSTTKSILRLSFSED